jgi:hypothetical protein
LFLLSSSFSLLPPFSPSLYILSFETFIWELLFSKPNLGPAVVTKSFPGFPESLQADSRIVT